jgi:hypothetical protein
MTWLPWLYLAFALGCDLTSCAISIGRIARGKGPSGFPLVGIAVGAVIVPIIAYRVWLTLIASIVVSNVVFTVVAPQLYKKYGSK